MKQETPLPEPGNTSRWVALLLVVLACLAVFAGFADPQRNDSRNSGETAKQLEEDRGDADAGFPEKPKPDEPPRGPGP
ncbi:MAG TPA: hypothetical protein VF662_08745 [Allosphingosinicella sp.]|jgi:hypothetical protein